MRRYATLNHPAPVWSIFDYAAALFVEPALEGLSLLGSFRSASRKVVQRPAAALIQPRRPVLSWRRRRSQQTLYFG